MKQLFGLFLCATACSCTQPKKENPPPVLPPADSVGPTAINVNEPKEENTAYFAVPPDKAFSILIDTNDVIFYYKGNDCSTLKKTNIEELKTLIKSEKEKVKEAMFIIKAGDGSTYRASVDILDEMVTAGVAKGHYMEDKLTKDEKKCIGNIKAF